MTRTCNFPISKNKRCKQPVADDKPNCGRHSTELSADQLGQSPTVYQKNGELHVWAGDPDGPYCLIHSDPAYQVLYQIAGEVSYCLRKTINWKDKDGWVHREDGPAQIKPDGTQKWFWRGWLHRDDGPAVIEANGTQMWFQHGKLHREDGPAVVAPDGTQVWYRRGKPHRDDGPAMIESDGTRSWWQRGKIHRDDGPAHVRPDGTQSWFWRNKAVTEEQYIELREQSKGV